MANFYFSNPFPGGQLPFGTWLISIVLYSFLIVTFRLKLFQQLSGWRVKFPVWIYLVLGLFQMLVDNEAILNDIAEFGLAIGLIYFFSRPRQFRLTTLVSRYLLGYGVFQVTMMLVGNLFQHLIHYYDPHLTSWIAHNIDPFTLVICWLMVTGVFKLFQRVTTRYFQMVAEQHYVWSWILALSTFAISEFDYAIIYRQVVLPTATIAYIFIAYLVILFGLVWFLGRYYQLLVERDNYEWQLGNLQAYTSEIESLYDDLRRFRHDYKNVLFSLDGALANENIPVAKQVLKRVINPSEKEVSMPESVLGRLANVQDQEIKSILYSKLEVGLAAKLELILEVEKPFKFNPVITPVDRVRILSILLDNAITAAKRSDKKLVNVSLFEKGSHQYLVIGNSTADQQVNLIALENNLSKVNFGSNHGLGLKNLRMILARYPAVNHTSRTGNYWFEQVIIWPK